jgi:hypothetical protein
MCRKHLNKNLYRTENTAMSMHLGERKLGGGGATFSLRDTVKN